MLNHKPIVEGAVKARSEATSEAYTKLLASGLTSQAVIKILVDVFETGYIQGFNDSCLVTTATIDDVAEMLASAPPSSETRQ